MPYQVVMTRTTRPKTVENVPTVRGRIFGYGRVSTDDQDLGMQDAALKKYGCDLIFLEKKSAASNRRHQLNLLWKQLQPGDTLVVWRMDRLARSLAELIWRTEWMHANNIKFVSLTEAIDTGTAVGRLLVHLLGAVAEFERNLTKERTTAGLQHLKSQGVRLGKEPMDPKKKEAIRRDLLKPKLTNPEIAKKHGIGTSTIPYLFPGGRRAVVAAAEKAKKSRKTLRALLRTHKWDTSKYVIFR